MNWQPVKNISTTLQQQIINWFTTQLGQGDLTPGMRLPSQRLLALQFNVNRSTINVVMEELKARGLIETRTGDGTYISEDSWQLLWKETHPKWQQHIDFSVHKPNDDTIQLINEYEQYEHIIRLGTGELSPSLIPTKQIEHSLRELSLTAPVLGYSVPQGSKELREALCHYLQKRGIHTTTNNILITSGALQAFQLIALGLLQPGSFIFQQEASYLNSVHSFQSAGMRMTSVKINEQLQQTLLTKKRNNQGLFYAIPTLDNPTGHCWSNTKRRLVLEACKALAIPIIEDDVYHELLFQPDNELPLKAYDQSGHVLYIGSVSKTLSPGLRIGWIVASESVIKRLADIKMQTDYGSSALSQQLVAHWLQSGMYEQHIKQLRHDLHQRAEFVEQLLQRYIQPYAKWQQPNGGFYIWLRFEKPIINKGLFLELLHQNILINPGYIYQPNDFHHLRLSFAYASYEQLEQGIRQLALAVKQR
ncbi:PLP-dependent aminotransferase family protein [Solibacillus daqui]|uniref:aminotransferase-like domain-containing protein n=1 Tax=Solibacillus daqui TaxID=2912187 RepID=UPI0023671095|nr:PLP-dependent aminotransferase family protein [Solibacillus daqui]